MRSLSTSRGLLAAIALVAALCAGFGWAWSSPVGSSPDDDYHMSSIWCPPPLATSGCQIGKDAKGRVTGTVPARVGEWPCYVNKANVSAACELNLQDTTMEPNYRIDNGDYPGGYYRFMHLFVGPDVRASVLTMRLVNVGLATILLGAALALARSAGRRAGVYAFLGACVPVGIYLIGSVNPSAWSFVGIAALTIGLDTLLAGRGRLQRWGSGAVALAGAVLAGSARSDAVAFIVLAVTSVMVLRWRTVRSAGALLVVPVAALAVGVASVLASAQATRAAGTSFGAKNRYTSRLDAFLHNIFEVPQAAFGVFGGGAPGSGWGLGWFDIHLPASVPLLAGGVAIGLVMLGLQRVGRVQLLVMGGLTAFMWAWPLYMVVQSRDLLGYNFQPRYLLPAVVLMLYLVCVGAADDRTVRLGRVSAVLAALALAAAHGIALFTNLRRHTLGMNGPMSLTVTPQWWWPWGPSPLAVWLIGAGGFTVLALLLLTSVSLPEKRDAARGGATVAPPTLGATRA